MNNKLILMVAMYDQLDKALLEISNEKNEDYLYFKECDKNATPKDFLNEIIEVGLSQPTLRPMINEISNYYECEKEMAILLYQLTDAYKFVKLNK